MMYDQVIVLKKDTQKYIDRIGFFVCFFSILVFIAAQLKSRHFDLYLTISAIIISALVILNLLSSSKNNSSQYRNSLFAAGILWIGIPGLRWASLVFFLLGILEYKAQSPVEIGFSNEGVVFNSFTKKKFNWADFNNIVLKDGLLTLDFKTDKLYQKEIQKPDYNTDYENQFNDYCKSKIGPE